MKPSSAKQKGRKLQQEVRDALLENFQGQLEQDDIKSTSMGASGEDVQLSPAARKLLPYAIETKCKEKLNIWSALKQAEENANGYVPVVVFRRNHSKTYAVVDLEHFIELIKFMSSRH